MSRFRKNNYSNTDVNFWEFVVSVCLGGLLIACTFGYVLNNFVLVNSPRTETVNPTAATADTQPAPSVTLIGSGGITSDFEKNPKPWWINDEHTSFEVKNSSMQAHNVSLKFLLQKNPCGFSAQAKIAHHNSIIQLVDGAWSTLFVRIESGESLILPLTLSSQGCVVPTDPRIFFGALTTKMSFIAINEFDFGGQ